MPYTYPTNEELSVIGREKEPRLEQDRLIFRYMPIVEKRTSRVKWIQKDGWGGLQQMRGLGGQPSRVNRPGASTYSADPGYYGEYINLDEEELTNRGSLEDPGKPVNIDDLVTEAQEFLLMRELDRIEWAGWQTLQGNLTVLGQGGKVQYVETFAIRRYTAPVPFSDTANAAPLQYLRDIGLEGRGRSTSFGRGADYIMNQRTFNYLAANRNQADIAGKRTSGMGMVQTLRDWNEVLLGEELGSVVIYDQGYNPEPAKGQKVTPASFVPYVPDNKVIVVGRRNSGDNVLEYHKTRNVNNKGTLTGSYDKVVDKGDDQVPRVIEVHRGHNGGPAVFYPGSLLVMDV